MSLESVTYVGDLTATNPVSSDAKSQGDDHIRNIKAALRQSFAGFAGGILVTGTDGGSANTYTLTPTTAVTAYSTKMVVEFTPAATNTGASTLNISGLGAKSIYTAAGVAVSSGDLVSGYYYLAAYDGTQFRLLSTTKNYIDQLAFSTALPSQTGNSGKFVTTDGTNASWALPIADQSGNSGKYLTTNGTTTSWATLTVAGSGGTTATGNVTLTSASAGALSVTPTAPGLYVTLPDATTCSKADNNYSVYNAGDYDYGVKDSAGTQLGWIRPRTGAMIGLPDNSTAAGTWAYYGLEKTGITANYVNTTATNTGQTIRRIALDSNRECFLFGGATCYAIVYDASTQTWGTATSVRASIATDAFVGVLSATDQVLVVSCDSTTAMEAVTLTISGTGVTVNTGTKGTATLAGNWAAFSQLIAVSTSWVVGYGRATNVTGIRAITVSGTTPTIGSEAALTPGVSTAPVLFASGSIVRTVNASATFVYSKPFTVTGSSLAAGTEASAATTAAAFRAFLNGNGNIVCHYINTTHYATIFKLTSTTEAASSVNLGTAPGSALNSADYVQVTASKTVFMSYPTGTTWYANILTDTSGTASAGTELSGVLLGNISAVMGLTYSGNYARFMVATTISNGTYSHITLDCSAATATLYSFQHINLYGSGSGGVTTAAPICSDLYGVRPPRLLISGTSCKIVGSSASSFEMHINSNSIQLRQPAPVRGASASIVGIGGGSANITYSAFPHNGSSTGFFITRIEAAA